MNGTVQASHRGRAHRYEPVRFRLAGDCCHHRREPQRKYTILMGDFWLEFVLLEEGLYLLCGRRQKTNFSESFVSDTPYYII